MRLLSERKNKLRVTENAVEKKGDVVTKVEKILHSKERKANYTERKRVERIMFAKVPSRHQSNQKDTDTDKDKDEDKDEDEDKNKDKNKVPEEGGEQGEGRGDSQDSADDKQKQSN